MANIELVIKIAEEAYQGIVNANKAHGQWGNDLLGILCAGIANGTQLPKGHGRLIDADAFGKELHRYTEAPYQYALKVFNDAPTIIGADKESEVKEMAEKAENEELIVNKDVYDTLTEEQKKFVDIGLSYFNNRKR